MKKTVVLLFCVFGGIAFLSAQSTYKTVSETQRKEIVTKIQKSTESLQTMQCNFVQKKSISILSDEIISEGRMYFKQKDKLCWQYLTPYQYLFIINGNKVTTYSNGRKNVVDVSSNKLFKEISNLILSGINGSGVFDQTKFSTQFMVSTKNIKVVLIPKLKEMKQLFKNIQIYFNTVDYMVDYVEFEELNGDKTRIEMKNKKINKELNDEIFAID